MLQSRGCGDGRASWHRGFYGVKLGYFDAFNSDVAILPIVEATNRTSFVGAEYLGLYPYVDVSGRDVVSPGMINLHRTPLESKGFDTWISTADKLRPTF